jgi:2-polyprenyl-3-methyl-5-hydroxy-6-metoxy-1,4-benzoquinol methylase
LKYIIKIIRKIKKNITLIIIKILLILDNRIYRNISKYVTAAGRGIHPKHRLMNYHDFFLVNIGPHDVVLDVGCGNGLVTYDVAKKARIVVGIDIDSDKIRDAKKNFLLDNIKYICGDITSWPFKQRFDVVILSNVLEHIKNRIKFLEKIKRLGRKFLIRVPMLNRSWLVLYKKEIGIEYRLDKTHSIEYTMESFTGELEEAGLKIDKYTIQFGEIWAVVRSKI